MKKSSSQSAIIIYDGYRPSNQFKAQERIFWVLDDG